MKKSDCQTVFELNTVGSEELKQVFKQVSDMNKSVFQKYHSSSSRVENKLEGRDWKQSQ